MPSPQISFELNLHPSWQPILFQNRVLVGIIIPDFKISGMFLFFSCHFPSKSYRVLLIFIHSFQISRNSNSFFQNHFRNCTSSSLSSNIFQLLTFYKQFFCKLAFHFYPVILVPSLQISTSFILFLFTYSFLSVVSKLLLASPSSP